MIVSNLSNVNYTYASTPLEYHALHEVNTRFEINEDAHKTKHKIQLRLYDLVRNFPPQQKQAYRYRSDIWLGTAWMINDIIHATTKNALTSGDDIVGLEPLGLNTKIVAKEDIENHLNHQFTDELIDIKSQVDDALMYLCATGCAVLGPNYRNEIKHIYKRDQGGRVVLYPKNTLSAPQFDVRPPWEVFPTGGLADARRLPDVIYYDQFYPHELWALQQQGRLANVDKLFAMMKYNKSAGIPEQHKSQLYGERERDNLGKIEVLTYWGYFPLNNYLPMEREDLTAIVQNQVPVQIVKPLNYDIVLCLKRNPYWCQHIPAIFGGYARVPGEFWPISIFEILEELLLHQRDWWNLKQDAADAALFEDEILPKSGIEEASENTTSPMKRYKVDPVNMSNGAIPQRIKRGPSMFSDIFAHSESIENYIQEVSAVMDFVKGMAAPSKTTAFEISELAERINVRFKQRALFIEQTLLRPVFNWMMSLNVQASNDIDMMMYTGKPFNPYAQFDAAIPNDKYRIKLEGAVRASESIINAQKFKDWMAICEKIGMGTDDNDRQFSFNLGKMALELGHMIGIKNVDSFKDTNMENIMNRVNSMTGGGPQNGGGGNPANRKRQAVPA